MPSETEELSEVPGNSMQTVRDQHRPIAAKVSQDLMKNSKSMPAIDMDDDGDEMIGVVEEGKKERKQVCFVKFDRLINEIWNCVIEAPTKQRQIILQQ